MDHRTLLAAGLGILLGLLCLLAPETVVRVNLAGRTRPDRHGEYGDDAVGGRLPLFVRAVGAVLLAGGAYFGAVAAGLV